jgi:hypothetical protein
MINASIPESDIQIDADGAWFYRGTKMIRQEIIALFYQHLRQDGSGCYFIEIGNQRRPVQVEDTAYVVWTLRWTGGGDAAEDCALLLLSDGSIEKLDPETLRIGRNHIPYCRVKNRKFEARFSRPGYYKLAERLHHDSANDAYFISLNGRQYQLLHKGR